MEFLDEKIDNYVCTHTTSENELLNRLNRETWMNVLHPRMLSGHLQGRALSMFSKMIQPKNILEIGTYTGYSALCLAEGLSPKGEIHTIDINEELEPIFSKYFQESKFKNQIKSHIGNALEIIPSLSIDFDIVFIDADKGNYINYYNLLIDRMKPGSFIIADNVLWSGKIIDEYEKLDSDTKTLVDYNKLIHQDNRVENILFPIRDGLMITRKK